MTRRPFLVLILALTLVGGSVALAQDQGDATTIVVNGQPTELVAQAAIPYDGFVYEIDPRDGTIAQGFVIERATTTEGSTIAVVLVVHDAGGWRVVGTLTGEATGPLSQAVAGSVLTLSVIGEQDE